MATLGENYDTTTTVQTLRNRLTAKGYVYHAPVGIGDLGVYMHPLRSRGIMLMGTGTDLAKVYQVRAVDNALRRT